jgi:lysophospholipid acyltransferase (LPLAT)-like uncharacterized protein
MSDSRTAADERRIAWAARIGAVLVRALGWTWRIRTSNDQYFRRDRAERRPVIFTLWHGQLLPLLYHHRGQGAVILISEHADGEIIARIAISLGYRTVRGSTSRGAARALIGLSRALTDGHDLAITPDGPRGPAGSFAPGAVIVAQRTGAPMVPVAVSANRGWRLRSWDRFLVPKPFARVHVAYGEPVSVTASDTRSAVEEVERARQAMERVERSANG